MEYHLSFETLILGNLGVCLAMLAMGWILDQCREHARHIRRNGEILFSGKNRGRQAWDSRRAHG
jgi:hypothetical protein